ncbi:hypothetical protein JYU34_016406 [Plutella xylostella]|uniref:Uncharacterized protein n=1 Tax=Plutella xylostella TaxID=51655 RepID=A0ABQ7Q2I4_PLUXY|nr:hypothetical protein JYU34_016406 [Plutella xylostella]
MSPVSGNVLSFTNSHLFPGATCSPWRPPSPARRGQRSLEYIAHPAQTEQSYGKL